MPKEAKRRFVGLDTEEVSLVDTPANEIEFLVVKNKEDRGMGATAKKEVVSVEAAEADDGDVTKALAHVNAIVDKIAGIVGTQKESKAPIDNDESTADVSVSDSATGDGDDPGDDVDDGDVDPPTDVETAKSASMKSVLEKCGLDAATVTATMAKLKAAGFAGGAPPFGKKPKGKDADDKKAKGKDDDDKKTLKSDVDAPLTMATLASAVQKAAAFTPARVKALQDAQDILKLVLEAVAPCTSPENDLPQVRTHSNPSSLASPSKKPTLVTKSAEGDEVVSTLKNLAGAVNGLLTRVEAIEKARPASNSADPEGATDTGTKKAGSMWSGVL